MGGSGVAPSSADGLGCVLRKTSQRGFGGVLGRRHTGKHEFAGLWSNSDSELSQESNVQNGTSCLQETGSKNFALKLGKFCDEFPRGDS